MRRGREGGSDFRRAWPLSLRRVANAHHVRAQYAKLPAADETLPADTGATSPCPPRRAAPRPSGWPRSSSIRKRRDEGPPHATPYPCATWNSTPGWTSSGPCRTTWKPGWKAPWMARWCRSCWGSDKKRGGARSVRCHTRQCHVNTIPVQKI